MLNSALTALLISLVTWCTDQRGLCNMWAHRARSWNLTMGVVWHLDEDGCCVGLVHTIGVL